MKSHIIIGFIYKGHLCNSGVSYALGVSVLSGSAFLLISDRQALYGAKN